MPRKILDRRLISLAEVKQILEEKAQVLSSEDMDVYQQATLDYSKKFTKTSVEQAKKIIQLLRNDFNVPETYAIMVANILPTSVYELRTIFEKESALKKLDDGMLQTIISKIDDILNA
ncbi:MAG: RNA polymerase Rpb4 [Promethearchaeota archaeon CR_4]|nr:MAG: RNA polymerase Rpb4 [Candidatus Lokiarchaeota archaeon CR_4]